MSPRRQLFAASLLLLVAALGVSPSGATFVSTSTYAAAVRASDDWTPPFVAVNTLPDYLSGDVSVGAAASDGRSLVASVELQYAAADLSSWTTLCVDTNAPYSCPWATTVVPDGPYQVRAIATDAAGLSTTSEVAGTRVVNSASVVLTNPGYPLHGSVSLTATFVVASVSITSPVAGTTVRGTVTVTADANSNQGVASVRIEVRPSVGVWAALCADTSAPYSCSWATSTSGSYDVRAVMTQGNGSTLVSSVVSVVVDNAVLQAQDVQSVDAGTSGQPATGDRLVLTYSALVDPATIKAGWTGAATTITVDLKDKKQAGALLADYDRAEFAGTNLGQVAFAQNYVKNNLAASFTGSTMVATTETVGGVQVTVITVTLGATSQSVNLHATTAAAAMIWTPTAQVKTAAGVACSTAAAVESGATDTDL